ncbi:MBL fold metallo-hydrolase [bacterium]|nr:MBL fold metallo-hydrolase [bacterium]
MKIFPLAVGMLETNGFVIAEGQDAVIIDPGDEAFLFSEIIKKNNLTLHAILLTHGHGDHIGGVPQLKDEYPDVPVCCHEKDARMLTDPAKNLAIHVGKNLQLREPDVLLKENEVLNYGALTLHVRHIPGHTPGHIVFVSERNVFAGDTLFAGSIGRWDFPGGNGNLLVSSIREKLLTLPDETVVYPGHGPQTTIGEEKRSNPYLNPNFNPDMLAW